MEIIKESNLKYSRIVLILGGISTIGLIIFIFITKWGLGLSDDSYYYVFPAQDYANGLGFHPGMHYPLLFTLLLVIPGKLGFELMDAAQWMNALLFGMNLFIVGFMIWYLCRSYVSSIAVAVGFLGLGLFFELHAWVMSEALYLFLTLCGFLFIAIWMNSQRSRWLILSGLVFGLSTATRYIGVSALIAGSILILIYIRPRNINNILRFLVSGFIPILGMVLIGVLLSGGISDRSMGYYPLGFSNLLAAVKTMVESILPGRFVAGFEKYWLFIILICIVWGGWFLLFKYHVNRSTKPTKTPQMMMVFFFIFCVVYLVVLIISRLFFDPLIPFDARLISPMLVVGVLFIPILIGEIWPRLNVVFKWGAGLAFGVLLLVNGIRTIETMRSYYEQGRGYNSARDHISETYAYLRKYPDSTIYSNAPAALYFWIGRHTLALPGPEGLSEMKARLEKDGGFVVLFDSIPLELYHLKRDQVVEGLTEQIDLSGATIYKSAGSDY